MGRLCNNRAMNILITNDDGYESEGIRALQGALSAAGHTTCIVAPDSNRSACSQSITTTMPLSLKEHEPGIYSCSGTPTDCITLSLNGVFDTQFDCVVSGINHGPNVGDDIIFSGTVAGARQATFCGLPALASSLCCTGEAGEALHFAATAAYITENLSRLLGLCDSEHLVNINAPNIPEYRGGAVFAHPGVRLYDDNVSEYKPPQSKTRYFFVNSAPRPGTPEPGSDLEAVAGGRVALCILRVHPEHDQGRHDEQQNKAW